MRHFKVKREKEFLKGRLTQGQSTKGTSYTNSLQEVLRHTSRLESILPIPYDSAQNRFAIDASGIIAEPGAHIQRLPASVEK
jgi:hypothetical protein